MKDIKNYIDIKEERIKGKDNKEKTCNKVNLKKQNEKLLGDKAKDIKGYLNRLHENDGGKHSHISNLKENFAIFLEKEHYNIALIIEDLNIILNS